MTAYELADELAECIIDGSTDLVCVAQAANMLRQQADRITELEKQGKPVAWMSPDGKVSTTEGILFHIPLYTTPQTKPLSDEEIMDIAEQSDYSPLEIEMGYDYEIRIARAIEERHGIK